VVGVLAPWKPGIKFYDFTQRQTDPPEEIYAPFELIRPIELPIAGNVDNWGPAVQAPGPEGRLHSEIIFIQMWVELPDRHAERAYHDWLDAYVMTQKKIGRFPRPLNNRLSTVPEMLELAQVVPPAASARMLI